MDDIPGLPLEPPVRGTRSRMVAVFSYYERPGVVFGESERMGFYGRA